MQIKPVVDKIYKRLGIVEGKIPRDTSRWIVIMRVSLLALVLGTARIST